MIEMTVERFNSLSNPLIAYAGRVACQNEYERETGRFCLWHGSVTECEFLNGVPICPECGSTVRRIFR